MRAWRENMHDPGMAGLTLVELLVVLGILAIMTALVVPQWARNSVLASNAVPNSARELFTMLKAAKIYAATNRVCTAVVYDTSPSVAQSGQIFNTIAMMYQLKGFNVVEDATPTACGSDTNHIAFGDPTSDDVGHMEFVPVAGSGGIKYFTGDTCIQGIDANAQGLFCPIYVSFYQEGTNLSWFNGNVFQPSGRMSTNSTQEMYTLTVGMAPDADAAAQAIPPVPVHLYRSTGRVKIGNEES